MQLAGFGCIAGHSPDHMRSEWEKAPKRLPGESRPGSTEPTLRRTRTLSRETSLEMQYCSFSCHAATSAEGQRLDCRTEFNVNKNVQARNNFNESVDVILLKFPIRYSHRNNMKCSACLFNISTTKKKKKVAAHTN